MNKLNIVLTLAMFVLISCGRNFPDTNAHIKYEQSLKLFKKLTYNGNPVCQVEIRQDQELDEFYNIKSANNFIRTSSINGVQFQKIILNINGFSDVNKLAEHLVFNYIDTIYSIENANTPYLFVNNIYEINLNDSLIEANLLYIDSYGNCPFSGIHNGKYYEYVDSTIAFLALVSGNLNADGNFRFLISGESYVKVLEGISSNNELLIKAFDKDLNELFNVVVSNDSVITNDNDSLKFEININKPLLTD